MLKFNGKTGQGTNCPVCSGEAQVRKHGKIWLYDAAKGCSHLNVNSGSNMSREEAEAILSEVRAWNVPGVSQDGWPVA